MISGPTTGRRSRTVDRACVQATLVVAKPMAYAVKISPRVQWREPQAGLEVQGEADQKSCVAGHPQRHGDDTGYHARLSDHTEIKQRTTAGSAR